MSVRTFTWSIHPEHADVLVLVASHDPIAPEALLPQVQKDLAELRAFIDAQFGGRPVKLLNVLRELGLALAGSAELAAQGGIAMVGLLNVERGAYVLDGATLRMQFARIIREQGLEAKLRTFSDEAEALAFLLDGG